MTETLERNETAGPAAAPARRQGGPVLFEMERAESLEATQAFLAGLQDQLTEHQAAHAAWMPTAVNVIMRDLLTRIRKDASKIAAVP